MSAETVTSARQRSRALDRRARVLERQDIREAIRISCVMAIAVIGSLLVLFGNQSLSRLATALAVIGVLVLILWLSRGPLRHHPNLCAFALVVLMLLGRQLPLVFEIGTAANLAGAYFGLIVVASAVFLPWSLRWHVTWLGVAAAVYLGEGVVAPSLGLLDPRALAFLASALVVSCAGSMIVRARRRRQHAAQVELLAERAELRTAHARLREAAQHDSMTGLFNRRRLAEDIAMLESRFARGMAGLAALMVDLDCFKQYNDAFGHHAGDDVLKACAAATRNAVRTVDRVYRYGGEELLVLLDEDDPAGAHIAAERIVAAVRALQIPHPGTPAGVITVSVGSSATNGRPLSPQDVIDEADRALYAAKAAGRNRAVRWKSSPAGASMRVAAST